MVPTPAELVAVYGEERLPRYTSYPTAAQFSAAVSAARYAEWLGRVTGATTASLYVHVPFCRSMCWYCGCHTTITRRDEPLSDYLSLLRREVDLVALRLGAAPRIRHLHFGGGTPTILQPAQLLDFMALLRARFPFDPDAEIAIEIDPRTLTAEMAAALGEAGFTRASLGVQSFDPVVQRAVNRVQTFAQTAAAVERLRAAGISGLNFDLIYGLPHQTADSCLQSVGQCLPLRPERLSVFGYAHVPSFKKHQAVIDPAALPDGRARHLQAEAIAGALVDAGYVRIGLDHYALPQDAIVAAQGAGSLRRNFQGYTTDASDVLIGLGASAIGRLAQGYVQNAVALRAYGERIGRGELASARGCELSDDDRLRAELIERVMCDFRVDLAEICGRHGRAAGSVLGTLPRLQGLAKDGIVRMEGTTLRIPDEARLLVRSVAAVFDAYLGTSATTHSRAV